METETGSTALYFTVRNNQIHIVHILLGNCSDVDGAENDGWASLITVLWYGHIDIAKFLIEHKAHSDLKTETDAIALYLAASIHG